jgi:hypothetical protein
MHPAQVHNDERFTQRCCIPLYRHHTLHCGWLATPHVQWHPFHYCSERRIHYENASHNLSTHIMQQPAACHMHRKPLLHTLRCPLLSSLPWMPILHCPWKQLCSPHRHPSPAGMQNAHQHHASIKKAPTELALVDAAATTPSTLCIGPCPQAGTPC